MAIQVTYYKEYELRSYSHQDFPTHHDPYATGTKHFSSTVRIDTIPFSEGGARRYTTVPVGADPTTAAEARTLATQYGKDIIDCKINPPPL
ncbi:hypothetical protein [Noviherbaspirillum galbum]|uniref:Uncharacterized protein n=1 Tax=Noviherbaspirillum galbum TaxID=2709383 RepID=A0A6B3SY81_9BURK|nr:hypothetical protein [Noviherbaspirillum galbum]NEX64655.1 hypothetical protein [Noviherbaspirillum galbum]